jgi:hypothetical protein
VLVQLPIDANEKEKPIAIGSNSRLVLTRPMSGSHQALFNDDDSPRIL